MSKIIPSRSWTGFASPDAVSTFSAFTAPEALEPPPPAADDASSSSSSSSSSSL
jgi:hypothetical protein